MTENAGQGETLAQRIRKRIEEERKAGKTINQPPATPISPSDQELIDGLTDRVVGIAHDMVERLGGNIDGLRQLVSNLQESGIQQNRPQVIIALLQTGSAPRSWRQNPEAHAVQSYLNNLIDQLAEEYGETALKQHLVEEFSSYADRYEMIRKGQKPDNSSRHYSNTKLAIAFKRAMILAEEPETR